MVKIDLTRFQEHCLEITATDIGLCSEKFSDIFVKVELKKVTDAVVVSMKVTANALMECDRTLREFVGSVSNRHELLLHYNQPDLGEDELLEPIKIDPKQRIFDATDVIRDLLKLAIPLRKIAPDAEEETIQTVFGARNPEIDHRWAPLLDVREELVKS